MTFLRKSAKIVSNPCESDICMLCLDKQALSIAQIEDRIATLYKQQDLGWKETRILVFSVFVKRLFEPDFLNVTSWAKVKFPSRERQLLGELAAARIENYLGVEVGTLSYFDWRSLFKINPWRSGPWDKTKQPSGPSNHCRVRTMVFDETIAARLRKLWEETVAVGEAHNRSFPNSNDLQEASAKLSEQFPELFAPPAARSGSEKWKMQAARLQKERQELLLQNSELRARISYLESKARNFSHQQEGDILSVQESVRRFYSQWESGQIQSPVRALTMIAHAVCPEI